MVNTAKNLLIMLNNATDALKSPSKTVIQKTAEVTGKLIGNQTDDEITKISKTSPQSSSKTVTNEAENIEHDDEIPKERYVSPEETENH